MSRHQYMRQQGSDKQSGMVSMVVTMIIMVMLSLIVLGFAKVSRRELRQGLDRQLISQATYASESGINDAQEYLKTAAPKSGSDTTCNKYADTPTGLYKGRSENLDGSTVVSCVLVTDKTKDLLYDSVGTNEQVVFPLQSDTAAINAVGISWDDNSANPTYDNSTCPPSVATGANAADNELYRAIDWHCPAGALRVDIVSGADLTRAGMLSSVQSFLLYPTSNSAVTTQTMAYGQQFWTKCSATATPRKCNAIMKLPATSTGGTLYYVRIKPIYRSAYISVRASTDAATFTPVDLRGTQAMIDSTGRANDVVKRLVARVPICPGGVACGKQPAGYALQSSETICKLYSVIPPDTVKGTSDDPNCEL